jgi:hypothetical protein
MILIVTLRPSVLIGTRVVFSRGVYVQTIDLDRPFCGSKQRRISSLYRLTIDRGWFSHSLVCLTRV